MISAVPAPRTLGVISPEVTYWTETWDREWFMMVLEKKVRTSMITRKTMIAVLILSFLVAFFLSEASSTSVT